MSTITGPLHPGAVRVGGSQGLKPGAGPQRPSAYSPPQHEPLAWAYFWLLVFFVVYCARPEDWIPGLHVIPLAKISGIFAALALVLSIGRSRRQIRHIPIEIWFTLLLTVWLIASSLLSPVWRGGAFFQSIDFAKMLVAMAVGVLTVTSIARLRWLLFVQATSVVAVSAISLGIGHSHLRVKGVLSGIYDNPNDLAFAIALTIPLCFAFFLRTRNPAFRAAWAAASLVMAATLFLTGSRGGFIILGIAVAVCLYHFGIQGKRPQLILITIVAAVLLLIPTSGILKERFSAMSGSNVQNEAYESYRERSLLIDLSLHAVADHPIFGLGPGDFTVYSGLWHEVHVAYLQVAVEGGIPALLFYLLIFWRGFVNLRRVRRRQLDPETQLFAWALHGMLIAFVVGALFAPDAYQYFPFFTVMYTAALRLTSEEQDGAGLRPESEGAPPTAAPGARRLAWLDGAPAAR
jgi:O-antigen ligase